MKYLYRFKFAIGTVFNVDVAEFLVPLAAT